jgi:hypothetical protein
MVGAKALVEVLHGAKGASFKMTDYLPTTEFLVESY